MLTMLKVPVLEPHFPDTLPHLDTFNADILTLRASTRPFPCDRKKNYSFDCTDGEFPAQREVTNLVNTCVLLIVCPHLRQKSAQRAHHTSHFRNTHTHILCESTIRQTGLGSACLFNDPVSIFTPRSHIDGGDKYSIYSQLGPIMKLNIPIIKKKKHEKSIINVPLKLVQSCF